MSDMVRKGIGCLGMGFDVNSDFKMKYCKGKDRIVVVNQEKVDLNVPGFGVFSGVPSGIKCDKGDRIRYRSDVLEFIQMSELMNQNSSITGKVPTGLFSSSFGYMGGSWARDASKTKCLAYDGNFISLFNLRLDRSQLHLSKDVVAGVPPIWDPKALSRFIQQYGTHVVVGLSMGGQDVVYVRQDQSSNLTTSELKLHLDSLGDQLFTGTCTLPLNSKNKDNRHKLPEAFNVFKAQPLIGDGFKSISSKKGITVICSKNGGDASTQGHRDWLLTVPSSPDAINFTFLPITSLLTNIPGRGFLTHAINLYLRYKPPLSDLHYFLEFQHHKIWAPVLNDFPLGPSSNRTTPTASLQLNLMGPKLKVNTCQVMAGNAPVTGMRLHLEGKRNDRLGLHLQHFSTTPTFLADLDRTPLRRDTATIATSNDYLLPIQKKKFSHVCTAPVKYDPNWHLEIESSSTAAFIVTGAQLHVKKHDHKSCLHLALLYSKLPNYVIDRSVWEQASRTSQRSSGFFSNLSLTFSTNLDKEENEKEEVKVGVLDSGVFASGPPVPVHEQKLLKFVDTSEISKGPQDSPGHWVVTGARLELKKGRIGLNVKFSLLCSTTELMELL